MDRESLAEQRVLLTKTSLELILSHQHEKGAFVASPTFSQYKFSWLRDNTYNAYALLLNGYRNETKRYLQWVSETILKHRAIVDDLPEKLKNPEKITKKDFLGARYTVDGEEDTSDWPNFQIDGYGSWLWLTAEFLKQTGQSTIPAEWMESIDIIIRYLTMVWNIPNSDCWEEHPDHIHPSTLACVAGGLRSIASFLQSEKQEAAEQLAETIKTYLLANRHPSGRFPKYIGSDSIDGSLLWLHVPYKTFPADHPAIRETVKAIEKQILEKGGVKRYPEDTYYGGGQWIILSAWLAWYYIEDSRPDEALQLLEWIILQKTDDGSLPEQILDRTNDPSMIRPWEERWGPVAAPLLWSHAMYLILEYQVTQYYTIQKEKNHE
ncbi:MAG: glycoside hydrolase family 15 protein [Spirochaetes bacterium]|nr:glycoside hydrolase family 15 protein [Spirochaetota bacterium]